jgi:hypothetical protein
MTVDQTQLRRMLEENELLLREAALEFDRAEVAEAIIIRSEKVNRLLKRRKGNLPAAHRRGPRVRACVFAQQHAYPNDVRAHRSSGHSIHASRRAESRCQNASLSQMRRVVELRRGLSRLGNRTMRDQFDWLHLSLRKRQQRSPVEQLRHNHPPQQTAGAWRFLAVPRLSRPRRG